MFEPNFLGVREQSTLLTNPSLRGSPPSRVRGAGLGDGAFPPNKALGGAGAAGSGEAASLPDCATPLANRGPNGGAAESPQRPRAKNSPPRAAPAAPAPPALVLGDVGEWRRAHPLATRAVIGGPLCDADLALLASLTSLELAGQWGARISAAGFSALRGLKKLSLAGCSQPALGDGALAQLTALEDLCIAGCTQATLTDAAFAPLTRLRALDMSSCLLLDAALARAPGLRSLRASSCPQLTDAALEALPRLRELDLRRCGAGVSDRGFRGLLDLRALDLSYAAPAARLSAALFAHLPALESARLVAFSQLDNAAFAHLCRLRFVDMSGSKSRALDEGAFAGRRAEKLSIIMGEALPRIIAAAMAAGARVISID